MKRILFVFVIVVVIAGIGLAAWWFLLGNGTSSLPPEGQTGMLPSTGTPGDTGSTSGGSTQNGEPPTGGASSVLTQLSERGIAGYAITSQGAVRVVEKTGQVSLISRPRESLTESSEVFQGIGQVAFVGGGTKAVVSFGGASGARQTSAFDASTKKWSALPSGILAMSPSPIDARIAYTMETGGRTALSTLDLKTPGQKPKLIASFSALDLALDWMTPTALSISERPSTFHEGSAWRFSLANQALTPIASDENGLIIKWNASGTLGLLFSSGSNFRGGALRLISPDGATVRALSFVSLPSKCDFGTTLIRVPPQNTTAAPAFRKEQVLYCAIPSDQREFGTAQLPDAYLERSLFTNDVFYRISLVDGSAQKLFTPTRNMDARDVRVASGTLYFIDRYDEFLYSLSLSE